MKVSNSQEKYFLITTNSKYYKPGTFNLYIVAPRDIYGK